MSHMGEPSNTGGQLATGEIPISLSATHGQPPTPSSGFFQVLPPELRRRILIAAFGNRTLHVRRLGMECIRRDEQSADVSPALDDCARRYPIRDKRKPRWTIGAIGWLLSCRQAYTEGIEVLYSTNTLHVRASGVDGTGNPLSLYLSNPQLLASIRSLEWVVQRTYHEDGLEGQPIARPGDYLRDLPRIMPNLQRLYVGFCEWCLVWGGGGGGASKSPRERHRVYTELILLPIDAILSDFGDGLKDLEVGLPTSAFYAHFVMGVASGTRFESPTWRRQGMEPHGSWGPRQRIWRPVPDKNGDTGKGYWLGKTDDDMPHRWQLTMPHYWR